ncbi:hypothetical protein IEQ34_001023 [Dendrobium chrysotoxum]|uniref:Uncharacterized protein n=1 Tax=Dendrobium chrysotoxum TaxID=161865 RepID=A0AAV7HMV1_DENCH|nr:hypothetical protein IEQ34_001023 [Dendrobium chrysotoxum]
MLKRSRKGRSVLTSRDPTSAKTPAIRNAWLSRPAPEKPKPFHGPPRQIQLPAASRMTSWGTPIGSIAKAYFPGDGSETLSHAVRLRSMPVFRLGPSFIPGSMVSVGWSKLCHKMELDDFTTKLPIVYRIPAIGDPDDGLYGDFVVPNAEIAIGAIGSGEEAERKGSVCGDEGFAIGKGMRWSNDVCSGGDGEEEEEAAAQRVREDCLSHHFQVPNCVVSSSARGRLKSQFQWSLAGFLFASAKARSVNSDSTRLINRYISGSRRNDNSSGRLQHIRMYGRSETYRVFGEGGERDQQPGAIVL